MISGTITSCLSYADANNDGVVDGTSPPIKESDLQLLHEEGPDFVDRTVSRDSVNNVICAETTSLSQLTMGAGEQATVPVPSLSPIGMLTLGLGLFGLLGMAGKHRAH